MVRPPTRSTSSISDAQMREMVSRDPDAPLRDGRGRSRLERLPAELQALSATELPPRAQASLPRTRRSLQENAQPNVDRSFLLHQVTRPMHVGAAPLFKRTDERGQALDDAAILRRLEEFMAPQRLDPKRPTIGELTPQDRAAVISQLLRHDFGQQDAALLAPTLALARPYVEAFPPWLRMPIVVHVAQSSSPRFNPDSADWSMAFMERPGTRGHGAAVSDLAYHVRHHFPDDAQCMQGVARLLALAHGLEGHDDANAELTRLSLATVYHSLPEPLAVARRLIGEVAHRPDDERAQLYTLLATGRQRRLFVEARDALPQEDQQALVADLRTAAQSVPRDTLALFHANLALLPGRDGDSIF